MPFNAKKWFPEGKHPDSDCVDFSVAYCKDWMHGNTIYWDIPEDVIYYNAKHQVRPNGGLSGLCFFFFFL